MRLLFFLLAIIYPGTMAFSQHRERIRDLKIKIGVLPAGKLNAITDVAG
jgi:D-aminopeptidase